MKLLMLLTTSLLNSLAPPPVQADIVWVASGEFCEPETVLPLPDTTLLVSNVCGFKYPEKGFLSLLNAQGDILNWRIVDHLDSPLGMAFLENKLYLIDNNRLKVFSWPDYQLQETVVLDTVVANDLAVAADGTVYVTDTAKHQVIEVTADRNQSLFTGKAQFKGANGAAVRNGSLFVGGEKLWQVNLSNHEVKTIGPDWLADIDGIEFEQDGTIQVTPVGGPLVRIGSAGDVEVYSGPGISSANHGYLEEMKIVLIPTGYENTVIAFKLPE